MKEHAVAPVWLTGLCIAASGGFTAVDKNEEQKP